MFGKPKDDNDKTPIAVQQPQPPADNKAGTARISSDQISTISRGMTVVGKIVDEGTVHVLGQVEGEVRALTVLIGEGAKVDGDLVAEELTIGGMVKGTIHAKRVRLNSTAVVEGDIFINRYRSRRMHALKDRQNVRTMLATRCAPCYSTRRPTATSWQTQPPSRAIGNPMGRQSTINCSARKHRNLA